MTDDSRDRLAERRGLNTDYYEPAEDSALLATAAEDVVGPDWLVLEVGAGSGYVAERVADATGVEVVGSDVNPHACERTRERGVEAVRGDFVGPFADGAFDAVLFNPPYLPTPEEVEWDDWTERALSGGESGRAVIDPFLDDVGRVLAPGGVVLLLVSSLTGLEAVRERAADAGFGADEVADAEYPYERLVVLALRQ
jgi:release factor glutamine methyltransferase